MSQAPSVALVESTEDSCVEPASVSLKGTTRGLEILISGTPSPAALGARLAELLAEAPGFFAGSTARIAIDGVLPVGALACLEDVATRFALRIVEIGPVAARRSHGELAQVPPAVARVLPPMPVIPPMRATLNAPNGDVPRTAVAEGAGPTGEDAAKNDIAEREAGVRASAPGDAIPEEMGPLVTASDAATKAASGPIARDDAATKAASGPIARGDAATKAASGPIARGDAATKAASAPIAPSHPGHSAAVAAAAAGGRAATAPTGEGAAGPRLVIGPVRSGMIVDHVGHLVVIGDVNPGAEVRAEGSIIVLGRLRGVAHAAIGRDAGCIIALSLQPQQLRIGRMVARAGDADRPSGGAEIAYATGETIVVERFLGRLPSGLAASM